MSPSNEHKPSSFLNFGTSTLDQYYNAKSHWCFINAWGIIAVMLQYIQ